MRRKNTQPDQLHMELSSEVYLCQKISVEMNWGMMEQPAKKLC